MGKTFRYDSDYEGYFKKPERKYPVKRDRLDRRSAKEILRESLLGSFSEIKGIGERDLRPSPSYNGVI
jgi:hypothetical protein